MEKYPYKDVDTLKEWLDMHGDVGLEEIVEALKKTNPCLNREKKDFLKISWAEELSEDPDMLKYREPETNMYYETKHVMDYIQNCRQRKQTLSDQDILDYEMVHKDVPQKLFFTIPRIYESNIEEISDALTTWLMAKTDGKDPEISIDLFEDKYIIVCANVMVENYKQKKNLLTEFGRVSGGVFHDALSPYILQQIKMYEEIPCITNSLYKNEAVAELIKNQYLPVGAIRAQLESLMPRHISGECIQITININGDINIYQTADASVYKKFIYRLLADRPAWFKSGDWVPKQFLATAFNEMFSDNISISKLIKMLKQEDLFKDISLGEKRSVYHGKKSSLFQIK